QVHAIYVDQGKDYSHAKVKKAFSKATKIVNPDLPKAPTKNKSAVPVIQSLADPTKVHKRVDVTKMFKDALKITNDSDKLRLAADAFMIDSKVPDFNSINQNDIQKIATVADSFTKTKSASAESIADAWVVLSGVCLSLRTFPQAIGGLVEAIRILKAQDTVNKLRLAAVHSLKSSVFALWGRLADSTEDLDLALELNPGCAKTRSFRCILLHRSNRVQETIDEAQVLYHLNPDGSFHHSDPCYMAAINLFDRDSLDAGKYWLELGDRFMYQYPTEKNYLYSEAHSKYTNLKRNAPKKTFDFPLRTPTRKAGLAGDLDRLGDLVYQKMVDASVRPLSKTQKFDLKKCTVDPSKMDTSIPLLPEDGDQSGLKEEGAQALREAWSEGMDFEPVDGMPLLHKKCFLGDIKWLKENQEWRMLELRVSGMRFTPLMCVIQGCRQFAQFLKWMDHKAVVELLLEKGAQINARCVIGNTSLFYASGFGCTPKTLEIAKVLLQNGAAVNIQNRFGATPLMTPIMAGTEEAIKLLVEWGADPKISDYEGTVPLEIAKSRPAVFQILSKTESAKLRTKADQADSVVEKDKCHTCASSERQLKYCPSCLVTAYCSTACQSEDWKAHKGICRKDDVVNVTLSEVSDKSTFVSFQDITIEEAGKTRPIRTIKIQSNGYGAHLVYDKERSFKKMISPDEPSYSRIATIVKEKGVLGVKGYFRAIVDDNTIKVLVSELLPPCDW
ncbi:hypothetical protein HDU99_000337, partial [Rhizoclosmatium hyalinum]